MALAIFWILLALVAILPVRFVVYLFFVSLAFGSFSTIPGGINLTPYAVCAPLLAVRVLGRRGAGAALGDALLNPLRFGLLSGFVLYALIVTATAPGLFHGIIIIGLNTDLESPLHYGMGNLTQSIYLVTAWLVVVSLYVLIRTPGGPTILARGMLLGGASVVLAGVADMATAGSGVLAPLRTASYAMMPNADMDGMRRVIGLNTEASSYGGITLFFASSLLFMRPARFAGPLSQRIEPVLMLALFVLCFLSTSSSAYLGMAMVAVLLCGRLLAQATTASRSLEGHRATISLLLLAIVLCAVVVVAMFFPDMVRPAQHVIDQALFHKKGTDSYIQRLSWSRISMEALVHSGGYGVGLGSTRASSMAVAVASSAGVIGSLLLGGFIARCLLAPLGRSGGRGEAGAQQEAQAWREMVIGARLAWLACLVPAASAATTVVLSTSAVFFVVMAGAGTAITAPAASRGAHFPARRMPRNPQRAR